MTGFDAAWLALREPADHAARATSLAEALLGHLPAERPLVVRDLGAGTGSMARWLAPRLPGPQRWVLYDADPALLDGAAEATAGLRAADGTTVEIDTQVADLTALRAADLAGAAVVTGSALLDLLTAPEVEAIAAACAVLRCPALFALSVTGRVELIPPDPLDAAVAAAFDAHQRRTVDGRALLGPDAPAVAAAAFRRHGMAVRTAASPWRLRPGPLTAAWLDGRAGAAVEQLPDLDAAVRDLLRRRPAPTAVVHHRDLLAVPGAAP